MLDLDGKISAIVESAELRRRNRSGVDGASLGLDGSGLRDGLVQGGRFSTGTLTALGVC